MIESDAAQLCSSVETAREWETLAKGGEKT